MGNLCRLAGLKTSELLAGLSELVARSNAITAEALAHLAEIEDRMVHLELGLPSLFAYCVEALGMSEGAAGRRVAAARVCRRFPEAFEWVARGDLHLSALCALSPHLTVENASELFEACERKSRRQVEELIAARFPRADVREQIRRLPGRAPIQLLSAEIGSNQGCGAVAASPTATSAARVGAPQVGAPRRREIEALAADRFGVHLTADAELRELIEQARALASHRLPKGDLASLMKLAFKTFVQHEEKRRFAVGSKPRKARDSESERRRSSTSAALGVSSAPPGGASAQPSAPGARLSQTGNRSRYVCAAVRREVYARDERQCSFVSADGRRCGARAFLQLDHVEPWAALGPPVTENIRMLCRAHNLLHARNCFGKMHVAAKIAARPGAGPERAKCDQS